VTTIINFLGKGYLGPNAGIVQGHVDQELDRMSGAELLTLYNLVSANLGRGRVNRFADVKTAIKRTWAILQDFAKQTDEEFEMPADEVAGQKTRQTIVGDQLLVDGKPQEGVKSIKFEAGPQLDATDTAQIINEAQLRKADPKPKVSDALINAAAAAKKPVKGALPVASGNAAKDAEMPALRRVIKPVNLEPKKKVYARKAGSKQAILVDMLSRPEGATFGELYDAMAATGKPWRGVTIRSGLAWDINHLAGYGVKADMLNGVQLAEQGRLYEALRLGMEVSAVNSKAMVCGSAYDADFKMAVYRLTYPEGMTAPLPHTPTSKA
jgi:hypothetical protein